MKLTLKNKNNNQNNKNKNNMLISEAVEKEDENALNTDKHCEHHL